MKKRTVIATLSVLSLTENVIFFPNLEILILFSVLFIDKVIFLCVQFKVPEERYVSK